MFIVGYPKSGNSWLCYLVAYCLNSEFDDYDDPGIHPKNRYIRKYVKGNMEHASFQSLVGKIKKTHAIDLSANNNEPVIYLIRDGRDVMVSYFHYEYSYLPGLPLFGKGTSLNSFLMRIKRKIYIKFIKPEFSSYLKKRLPDWINHVNAWRDMGYTALVCYEDLLSAPETTLINLFSKLGVDVQVSVIREAISLFQFDTLAGRSPGREDTTSFFRKGVAGDWKNYFGETDIRHFNRLTLDLRSHADCHQARNI